MPELFQSCAEVPLTSHHIAATHIAARRAAQGDAAKAVLRGAELGSVERAEFNDFLQRCRERVLQNTERVLQISQLLEEGNTAVLARLPSEGAGSWAAPRSPGKCRGKLQSAQLRLLLCFLQHDRLAEHCPPKLREWGLLEDIGGCITVHELLTDAFWEQAGRTAGLGDEALLATIRAACTEPEDPTVLDFDGKSICDAGATVVGAALGAMDAPLPFEAIYLDNNELTAAGMRSIAEGMGRGRLPNLREVGVGGNPALGDGGAAALAEALADCASLEELHFASCGVGGVGFAAVAACVPQWPKLQKLFAYQNPGPSDALGRALAAALPSLPDAESVSLWESGLGEGATAEVRAAAAGSGVELDLTLQVGDGQDSESSSDDGQGDDY